MSNPSANDILLGGGLPSAKFEAIGDTVRGTIVKVGEPRQATDPATNNPKVWPSGDPVLQFAITLQTDDTDNGANGQVNLWVQAGSEMQRALAKAIRAAGANEIAEGATVAVQYTGTAPSKMKGGNPKKLYEAAYQAPANKASGLLLGETNGQAPAPQATSNGQPQSLAAQAGLNPAPSVNPNTTPGMLGDQTTEELLKDPATLALLQSLQGNK
jgi:hypothetical protein